MTRSRDVQHVGVLLSGIGGWECGLLSAGWRLDWSCEQEAGKRALLARHLDAPCYGSVAEVVASAPTLADGLLVIGGQSAQEMDDPRWQECLAVVDRTRPRMLVLETTESVLTPQRPEVFARVIYDIQTRGYMVTWVVMRLGLDHPMSRWARLMVIGWPMGVHIPAALIGLHGRTMAAGNVALAFASGSGNVYPIDDREGWASTWGFPAGWVQEGDDWLQWLRDCSAPLVTASLATTLLMVGQELTDCQVTT